VTRGGLRRSLWALGLMAVASGAVGLTELGQAGATAPATVVISHAVAVQTDEVIQVSGTGTPGESLVIIQCGNYNVTDNTWVAAAGTCSGYGNAPDGKGSGTPDNVPIIVDGSGSYGPISLTIRRQWVQIASGKTIACRERNTSTGVPCFVQVNSLSGGATQAELHMAPTISVTPSTNLTAGQVVSVTVADMPSSVTALGGGIALCPTHAPYTSPVAGHGVAGQELTWNDVTFVPTLWVPDYCGAPPAGGQNIGTAVGADGSVTVNYTIHPSITNSNYAANGAPTACNPGATCNIVVFIPGQLSGTKAAKTPVTLAAPVATAVLSVTDVVGQTVNDAARVGDQIVLAGTAFADGSATVELCDVDGTSNCASIGSGTVSGGTLSGTVTVPAGATTGLRSLKATSGASSDTASFTILAAPTVAGPASAAVGASITVTGSSWNPSSTTTQLQFLDASSAAIGSPTALTVSSIGGFTTNVVVPAGAASIQVSDGPLVSSIPFTPAANEAICDGINPCSTTQQVTQVVNSGSFTYTQLSGVITMSPITLNGAQQTSTGSLQDLTIIDARGTNAGWSLTATLSDFTDGTPSASGNHVIPKGNLRATPTCTANTGGTAVAGAPAQSFIGPVALCTSPAGDSGGEFTADAGLSLDVPATAYSGTYTATMTLLVV